MKAKCMVPFPMNRKHAECFGDIMHEDNNNSFG